MTLTHKQVWKIIEGILVLAVVASVVYFFLNRVKGPDDSGVGIQPPVSPSTDDTERQFAEMAHYMSEQGIKEPTKEEIAAQFAAMEAFKERKSIETPTQEEISAQFKAMQDLTSSPQVEE